MNKVKSGIGIYRRYKKDKCEICNSNRYLIVHHKNDIRFDNRQSNLMTLCSSCHRKLHKSEKNFKNAYLKLERNKFGRFGKEKPIGKIICINCQKITDKNNPKQKYCSVCTIKLNTRHK